MNIKTDLCLYNPKDVYHALTENTTIVNWLEFVGSSYNPPKKEILLLYPCSAIKPYNKSLSYVRLLNVLQKNNLRQRIHLVTVSEPFGLVPEDFYENGFTWYDCPGLFKWWCSRNKQTYEEEYLEKSIDVLSNYVSRFLVRAVEKNAYGCIVALVRTMTSSLEHRKDHTHYRMLENASRIAGIDIELLPRRKVVENLVNDRGRLAWDYYGVSHPAVLRNLVTRLKKVLRSSACDERVPYRDFP